MALSILQTAVFTVLKAFLASVLPAGVEIVQGQDNLVPEPASPDYVVMWPLTRSRLATNGHSSNDVVFTASILANNLTVSAVRQGQIALGATLWGVGVTPVIILSQTSGTTGGPGVYVISGSPQTVASETMAAGSINVLQRTQLRFQLDVHGPNSADNAQVITTLLRDEVAVSFFDSFTPEIDCEPLYVEEPRQAPFVSGEEFYEQRWTVDAVLQANPVISSPMQFADSVEVELASVEAQA